MQRIGHSEKAQDLANVVLGRPVKLHRLLVPLQCLQGASEPSVDLCEVVQRARLAGDIAKAPMECQGFPGVAKRRRAVFRVPVDKPQFAQRLRLAGSLRLSLTVDRRGGRDDRVLPP
jgi:hypothetical protein